MTNRQVKSPRSQKTSDNQKQSETGHQLIENLKFKSTEIQKEPWIANQIIVKSVNLDDKGFHYEILFENFLGVTSKTIIDRADCFVNFPKVIAQFEQSIRDLMIFGMNSVGVLRRVPPRYVELMKSYGLEIWLVNFYNGNVYFEEESLSRELEGREKVFQSFSCQLALIFDALLH